MRLTSVNTPLASGQTAAPWMLSRPSFGAPRNVRGFSGSLREIFLPTSIRHLDTPFQNPRAGGAQHGVVSIGPGLWGDPGIRRGEWWDLSGCESGHYECGHRANGQRAQGVEPVELW